MQTILSLSAILALAYSANAYSPEALADEVVNLPGSENLNAKYRQFSGYLDIPGSVAGKPKHMHYWFVESEQNPTKDPLAFWTNGGPGCSGLLGFLTEQGPFKPNKDMTLRANEYAWNKISNMVFIESPAGVGFSYADNKDDLKTNDAQTAVDNYNLIQAFLTRFPDYRTNDLYISSESYGGHYMPTLAKQIVDSNKASSNNTKLNFKGFAVGNPYTNPYSGTPAEIDTYYGHQLISQPIYEDYVKNCGADGSKGTLACERAMMKAINAVGNLNPYALDYPVCLSAQSIWQMNHQLSRFGLSSQKLGLKSPETYEPCEENYAESYLNLASVKAAMHVKSDIKWGSCSYTLRYDMADSDVSTAPIYNYLIDGKFGLNILVYSGDDDGVCGTVGTQSWIWKLGYQPAVAWEVSSLNGQTVGYLSKWKDTHLGFLTVHGAGHEVPTYKPDVALDLWKKYLAGELTDK